MIPCTPSFGLLAVNVVGQCYEWLLVVPCVETGSQSLASSAKILWHHLYLWPGETLSCKVIYYHTINIINDKN